MALDLSSLEKAIDMLQRSVNAAQSDAISLNEDIYEAVRAGVIQNFEVAYELSWKFVQRWIRENRTPEDAEHPRTRKYLFRLAATYGLVADPEPWFVYGDARNLTSHTYNEMQAISVYETAKDFLSDAQYLLEQLKAAND
ncbi:MAG: HI0074 family nucleotidyltransferase substrate-binding subunit [Armatimonadota bacterium]